MKRSQFEKRLKDTLLSNGYPTDLCTNAEEMASIIMWEINEAGLSLKDEFGEFQPWEPEEGWDAYFSEQDRKDQQRDFKVTRTSRSDDMARTFLEGNTFEEVALLYGVTRERVRQCVAKARRKYQRGEE